MPCKRIKLYRLKAPAGAVCCFHNKQINLIGENMLEIKHVTKVYKTKGGVDTKALDDVSISFGETGLVFLLGKSG